MHVTDTSRGDEASLASRYLADQLTEDERAAFEARLLEDPAVLADLEATARLKVGLENLRESGELDRLLKPRWGGKPGWFALAASIGLAMIGVVLWRIVQITREPSMLGSSASFVNSAGQPLQIGMTYALLRTRTNNTYDATVQLSQESQALQFRALPDPSIGAASYDVAFSKVEEDGSSRQLASLSDLAPADDGFVTFYVNSALLSAGRYQILLSPADDKAGQEPESFLIRVVPPSQ